MAQDKALEGSAVPTTARRKRLALAAPQMAAVYERTFGVPLRSRIIALLAQYPDVVHPNWLSWEGHRTTNIATTAGLESLLAALEASV